ncbi:methyltransferase type 11 [Xylariaceae sp. FL0255]|nr:methyltransferase type 11 [Xylariaceae sp. FL0255]
MSQRWSSFMRPWGFISVAIPAHWKAFKEAYNRNGISAIFRINQIRDAAVASVLSAASKNFIAFEDTTTVPSLVGASQGTILELGPGPGNQIHNYDPVAVDFIYAIDPNPRFASDINTKLNQHVALKDKYKFIACGIEDSDVLREEGIDEGSLDTITSIQVLCAVDDVTNVMKEIYKLLKPGGRFIFWEHGKSKDTITGMMQAFWNPYWNHFVGCRLTRDVKADILAAGEWENVDEIKEANDPYGMLPRLEGVLIKKR